MEKKMLARHALGNPRRIWTQDYFMLSTFSPGDVFYKFDDPDAAEKMRRAVKTCADAGFNLLELGWATPVQSDAAVRMCEQLGMKIIYQDLKRYGATGGGKPEKDDLMGVMGDFRKWKSIAGYYIWDEPAHEEQLKETRRLMDLCQRERPDLLPFTVAFPSYNMWYTWKNGKYIDYLDRFAGIIDPPVFSFDYYPVGMKEHDRERQLDESFMWCDLAAAQKIAESYDIPFWFYYQGQNLHHEETFIFPMVRLMMNAGLMYGAKGLQHYTAWESVVNTDGGRGEFFEDQKDMHAQLRELGNTLMALRFRRIMHDESLLSGHGFAKNLSASMEDSELLTGKLPFRVSASEHEDDYGNQYLMVLNRDYLTEKQIALSLRGHFRVWQVSPQDGQQHLVCEGNQLSAPFIPGEMKLYRLQNASEEPCSIEYYLDK